MISAPLASFSAVGRLLPGSVDDTPGGKRASKGGFLGNSAPTPNPWIRAAGCCKAGPRLKGMATTTSLLNTWQGAHMISAPLASQPTPTG